MRFSDIADNLNALYNHEIKYKKYCDPTRIPKAALNIIASGFSYPTSEDIITASNL